MTIEARTVGVSPLIGLCFLVAVATWSPSAFASPIQIVDDYRMVSVAASWSYGGSDGSAGYTIDDQADSPDLGGAWAAELEVTNDDAYHASPSIARAGQYTTAGGGVIAGSGFASGLGGDASGEGGDPDDEASYYYYIETTTGSAASKMIITFDVIEEVPFVFTASFLTDPGATPRSVWHLVQLARTGESAFLFKRGSFFGFDLLEQGFLAPGRYTLRVESSVSYLSTPTEKMASFDFSMVVPEPGSALLVGVGLAAMARTRRRSGILLAD